MADEIKLCKDCDFWKSRHWKGNDGYCDNPKSDHYQHMIIDKGKHHICPQYERVKELTE